jgi:tetratricopeptide (TPR) repeat protein
MARGINYLSFGERRKLGRVLKSVTAKYGDIHISRAALEEAASVLEAAVEARPSEWVFWYTLGDLYQPLREFVKSVGAAERCYELRPKDPRSAYALATNLRTLTHAKYLGRSEEIEARRTLQAPLVARGYAAPIDPDRSQAALEELGLNLDQAAERSLTLFEEVLSLGVPEPDAIHVRDCLAAMYSEFPHLEERVKSSRVAPKGLLAEARGDPFNEAVEHYQKLRYLGRQPRRLQDEILEVIRLTQAALAKDRRNGDAMVLLAHALLLASWQALPISEEGYVYFLTRAATVIAYWPSARTHTRNKQNGEMVDSRIRAEIRQPKALTTSELLRQVKRYARSLLSEALDPSSLPTMQRFIGFDETA